MILPAGAPFEPRSIDGDSPNFPEVDPLRDVVIECERCSATASIAVFDITNGEARVEFRCQASKAHCPARVVSLQDPVLIPHPQTKGKTSKASS